MTDKKRSEKSLGVNNTRDRPLIVPVLVVLALVGLVFIFIHRTNRPRSSVVDPTTQKEQPERNSSEELQKSQSRQTVSTSTNKMTDQESNSLLAGHKAYVESRTAELMDLAMTDDSASLDIILSELSNRDPEIRQTAREAAVQFGSRDAIPKLTETARQTDDPQEKAALLEAADFLNLPSLSEQSKAQPQANTIKAAPPFAPPTRRTVSNSP